MDERDLRILQVMGFTPVPWRRHPPGLEALRPSHVADEVGLSPEAVRKRIRSLEESGAIQGYEAYPSIEALDHDATGYLWFFDDPDGKAQGVDEARAIEGVVEVLDFMETLLFVHLAHGSRAQERSRLERLREAIPASEPMRVSQAVRSDEPPELTDLDWRIVDVLRGDAMRPLSEVAEDVGVSYRTVKRHVDRMADEGALRIAPKVEPGRFSGVIVFDLFCIVDPEQGERIRSELRDRFAGRILEDRAPWALKPRYLSLVLHTGSVDVIEQVRREAAALEGVASAHAAIPRRRIETPWLDVQIANQLEGSPGGG